MKLFRLVANAGATYRKEVHEGRDYYVCPVTMMTPGVHSGNEGPLLYNAETNDKYAFGWSNKPITDGHPTDKIGNVVPANNPTVLSQFKLGILLNSYGENGRQKAEAWLDIALCKEKRPDILANVEAGKAMEVSIGLGRTIRNESGKYDGADYIGIVENYAPDHLAIMPPGVPAACGLDKGAGLLINGKKPIYESIRRSTGLVVNGDMKLSEMHEDLWEAFIEKYGEPGKSYYGYLCEVYTTYFIVEEWDTDTYWKQAYTMTGDSVSLDGEKQKVEKEVTYKIVTNSKRECSVERAQLLAAIAAMNLDAVDKGHFEKMNDMTLRLVVNAFKKPEPETIKPEPAKTIPDLLKFASPEVALTINSLVEQDKSIKAAQQQERDRLIAEIVSVDSTIPKADLEQTPTSILVNQLKILKTPPANEGTTVPPSAGFLVNNAPVVNHRFIPTNPWAK